MPSLPAVMLGACLVAIIAFPLMVLRALSRSAKAPARREGEAYVLKSSPASYWAAVFCLIAPVAVTARILIGQEEPDFSVWNGGPLAGMIFAGFATGIAVFLAVRAALRVIRFDAQGVRAYGRAHRWDELEAAGLGLRDGRPSSAAGTVARFRTGRVVVRQDMEGRAEFDAALKREARRRKIRWGLREDGNA